MTLELAWTWAKKGAGFALLLMMSGLYIVAWTMDEAGSYLEPRLKHWLDRQTRRDAL